MSLKKPKPSELSEFMLRNKKALVLDSRPKLYLLIRLFDQLKTVTEEQTCINLLADAWDTLDTLKKRVEISKRIAIKEQENKNYKRF